MGLLGISLLFVGIVLVVNGVNRLGGVDAKSTAFMNVVTGSIITIGNLIALIFAFNGMTLENDNLLAFTNIAGGLLFGITYLFIAGNYLFKLDLRPFGWFSLFVAIFAIIQAAYGSGGVWWLVAMWLAWAVLWLEGFLELSCGMKKLGKIFPWLSIAEGIFAAFIPSMLLLMGVWTL